MRIGTLVSRYLDLHKFHVLQNVVSIGLGRLPGKFVGHDFTLIGRDDLRVIPSWLLGEIIRLDEVAIAGL